MALLEVRALGSVRGSPDPSITVYEPVITLLAGLKANRSRVYCLAGLFAL